ncbi:unnamed protein product [Pelagomonas calceolata]|uniref:Uncharacterized protein n=1 Tax=Pelagomonas calceolata TaxID=35677 RepID=A0A8J2SKN0_9STRA|nr:unnamed protein product [Pelagomonas calceolata]
MAAAATLPPRVSTLGHGPRVLGAAAPAAEALGLGAAMRDRPLGPLSPNPDDWGQYVDDDDLQTSEDDGYASTVSLVRGSQDNLSRDVSSQSLDSLCELAAAKQSRSPSDASDAPAREHCLSTLHQLVAEDLSDEDTVLVVARGPGSARFEQERWSSEAHNGCAVPRSASYSPATAPSVWSREFEHGVVVGCSLGGIRVRRERLWHYASYRLLVSTEATCTERWLRHSDLRALHSALPATAAFDRVRSLWNEAECSRKRWRSLDLSYLVQRRRFYEAYIAELVFAVSSPDELAFYLGSGRSAAARVAPRAAREAR